MVRFEVAEVWDLSTRGGFLVNGRTHKGVVAVGMALRDESTQRTWRVVGLQFPFPRELEEGTRTLVLGRTGAEPPAPGTHLVG
ncbi:hypothetical protein [Pseudonocardia adelaidensis]|uniref:Uncharacterized protein n=1 Tax=Pseudonocardia adelaidensis TaxID=648754 RepID=A0ABP9NXK8_9PSEU